MGNHGYRLKTSHNVPRQQLRRSSGLPERKHEQAQQRSKERQRDKAEAKLASVKRRLLERLGDEAIVPLPLGDGDFGDVSSSDRHHFMARFDARVAIVSREVVRTYVSATGRFRELDKVLRQYCSHLLALEADAVEIYVQLEIRRALDQKLTEFERLLAALDKRRSERLPPLDPKTYEALLSREVEGLRRFDLHRLARTVLVAVEERILHVVDAGEVQGDFSSIKGYQAVRCKIGDAKRTACFFIVEPATRKTPFRVITLQTPREFGRRQRRPKSGITREEGGQRFAQRPKHLRHLVHLFCPLSLGKTCPRLHMDTGAVSS